MTAAAMAGDPDDTGKSADGRRGLPIPGLFDGFAAIAVDTARVRFAGVMGGNGSAVLLLPGYPDTHAAWHDVAPLLARHHTVVVPDLPGYGRSLLGDDGAWDKREVAAELVLLMRSPGHERGGLNSAYDDLIVDAAHAFHAASDLRRTLTFALRIHSTPQPDIAVHRRHAYVAEMNHRVFYEPGADAVARVDDGT